MVVSLTLGFMLYAFTRVKFFKERPINMVNIGLKSGRYPCAYVLKFVCMCAKISRLLNVSIFVYVLLLARTI